MKRLLLLVVLSLSFNKQPKPRVYVINVPEQNINVFYSIMNGDNDKISAKDHKIVFDAVVNQILIQEKAFKAADSTKK